MWSAVRYLFHNMYDNCWDVIKVFKNWNGMAVVILHICMIPELTESGSTVLLY